MLKWILVLLLGVLVGIVWESPTAQYQLMKELSKVRLLVNTKASQYEPWQIMALSVGATILIYKMYLFLFREARLTLRERVKAAIFSFIRQLPVIKTKIDQELKSVSTLLRKDILSPKQGEIYHLSLPNKGLTQEEVMQELSQLDKLATADWKNGKVSGCAYNCNEELTKLCTEVFSRYSWSNPLHPDVFPEVRKMEAELIIWCVKIFNGGADACGCTTSGGTESILMAMKAYRELGYSKGIQYPEIICCTSTHSAFDKAAKYFQMKIVHVKSDPLTHKVNIKAMKRAISRNTVVLVGSAPQFPHGTIDPIGEIAKLARKYKVGLHVDCCLGGFILPFMDKAGFPIEPFDFRLPEVTSISADLHKYGYTPKGISVLLYSRRELRRFQFFVTTEWQGGIYASPTQAGSRPGSIIAASWACMMYMGIDGYVESTRKVVSTTRWIAAELEKIPNIHIVGIPTSCIVAFGSKDFDIYRLNSLLSKRGWRLNSLQFPPAVHLCVTVLHTHDGVAAKLISDVKEVVAEVMKNPSKKAEGAAAFYGTSQSVSDRSIIADVGTLFIETQLTAEPYQD